MGRQKSLNHRTDKTVPKKESKDKHSTQKTRLKTKG